MKNIAIFLPIKIGEDPPRLFYAYFMLILC